MTLYWRGILCGMQVQVRGRTAALLGVFGVYLTGTFLIGRVEGLLVRWRLASAQNPLADFRHFASDAT
jgi:hypothetical protein